MENQNNLSQEQRDPKLWKIAKKRAGFKRHLATYIIINVFLWMLWLFTSRSGNIYSIWPIYVTLGWGIGLMFNFVDAYLGMKDTMAQKEYEKLVKQ